MAKKLFFLSLCSLFYGCNSDDSPGSPVDVEGVLASTQSDVNVPTSPTPSIVVLDHAFNEFPVEFDKDVQSSRSISFKIKRLPNQTSVVFQVSHGSLDSVLSFPITIVASGLLELAAVPIGTIGTIQQEAISRGFVNVINPNRATILGQIEPSGLSGCQPITRVKLTGTSLETNLSLAEGPFYFDSNGLLQPNQISDLECSYIFFNVPAGTYLLQFLDAFLGVTSEHEVLALAGQVSFGYNVP